MSDFGYATQHGESSFFNRCEKAAEWYQKSAESGNVEGMAHHSYMLKYLNHNIDLSNIWAQKALGK